jgi:cholesterol transport system auxiliary component
MHRFLQAFLAGLTCCLLGACALLSKAEPRVPRYFTPERATSGSTAASTAAATGGMRQLRLGNVRGSSELQERIMYRASPHEVGYHDGLRWTQRPEVFLRRALARALFEERGVARALSGLAPTLDVELVAFEELGAPAQRARVEVIMTLEDDQRGSFQQTLVVEQAVQGKADDALAGIEALSSALYSCVAQIAARVLAELSSTPAAADARVGQP